jgi:anthranilate phosphoribosyltransferase
MDIPSALQRIVDGKDLTQNETAEVFRQIMSGEASPGQIGAVLTAFRVKGESAEEIAGAAMTMRSLATKVQVSSEHLVDTCGTGGSGTKLFNISTAAAFVTAASGARVAKHGNRKMTSFSGSADVLEAAGVVLNLSGEQIATCINDVRIGFMFAPAHHSAMRFAGPIRQEIGIRTMMNVLGPMTNPAGAKRQVIGVFSADWQNKMAQVLGLLGSEHALIVHSKGLDEIRLDAPTNIVELKHGEITEYEINAQQFGFAKRSTNELDQLVATSTQSSLELIKLSLTDEHSAAADIVSLNAGASIYASGVASSLESGIDMARETISNGLADERFNALIRITQTMQDA